VIGVNPELLELGPSGKKRSQVAGVLSHGSLAKVPEEQRPNTRKRHRRFREDGDEAVVAGWRSTRRPRHGGAHDQRTQVPSRGQPSQQRDHLAQRDLRGRFEAHLVDHSESPGRHATRGSRPSFDPRRDAAGMRGQAAKKLVVKVPQKLARTGKESRMALGPVLVAEPMERHVDREQLAIPVSGVRNRVRVYSEAVDVVGCEEV